MEEDRGNDAFEVFIGTLADVDARRNVELVVLLERLVGIRVGVLVKVGLHEGRTDLAEIGDELVGNSGTFVA